MTDRSTEGIKTVLHPVSDLAKAKPIYAALLGIEPQADADHYVGFDVAGQHVGLVWQSASLAGAPVAYWEVSDIESKLAEVIAAGAKGRMSRAPLEAAGLWRRLPISTATSLVSSMTRSATLRGRRSSARHWGMVEPQLGGSWTSPKA